MPRERILRLESLEDRNLLAAAALPEPSGLNGLSVDRAYHDTSRILVRFRSDAPALPESAIPSGSRYGRTFPLVSGLREIELEDGVGVEDALAWYRKLPSVLYAEPDYRLQIDAAPGDPQFGQLWGLHNTGQAGGTADADIDAPEAWDVFSGTGATVVAVIDTGVDYTHPDLAANMWRNPAEVAGNARDDDGNGLVDDVYGADFVNGDGNPIDDHGHGTHVAGTIAAVHNNGQGVAGVNPKAKIMALKFLDASGRGSVLDAVAAFDYAVAHGARVSNNSWGGGGFSQALADAIQRARQAGHVVVAAAGNSASNNDTAASYPAGYDFDNILSVAATDRNDRLASFSNFGLASVDIAAPGQEILSTTPGHTYSTFSGTSMATPHVTGVVSLVWDQHPDWTYARVIGQVLATADAIPSLAERTVVGGRLNAAAAVRPDTRGPRIVSSVPRGSIGGSAASVVLRFSEPIDAATFTLDDIVLFTGPGGNLAATGVSGSGTVFTISFANQTALGEYTMVIGTEVRDLAGNRMDQDADGIHGEASQDAFAAAFQLVQTVAFASSDVPLAIQDNTTVVSYLDIDQDITIADLNVGLDISHTWDSDLRFYLVGPGDDLQTHVVLSAFHGGGGDGYADTVFDDEAPQSIVDGGPPFSGSYRPEEPLAFFDGRNARGRWTLVVEDAAPFDQGQLNSWSLVIQPAGDARPREPPHNKTDGPFLLTGTATSTPTLGNPWTTVTLDHTYSDMVVVAVANYGAGQGPAVVRIRNAQGNSFQFQTLTPGGSAIGGIDVHYLVVEAGVYTQAVHGITMEAVKFNSAAVDRDDSWVAAQRAYQNPYTNPVVFGQVMTANDGWSAFWSRGDTVANPPSPSALYVGRHAGEDSRATTAAETIGYIVFEAGSGTLGELAYEVGVGGDTVRGVADSPPYSYTHGITAPTAAIVSQTAMDGLNGSWALLYGTDPLGPNRLAVAVDEDQTRDAERFHVTEQVAYIVFGTRRPAGGRVDAAAVVSGIDRVRIADAPRRLATTRGFAGQDESDRIVEIAARWTRGSEAPSSLQTAGLSTTSSGQDRSQKAASRPRDLRALDAAMASFSSPRRSSRLESGTLPPKRNEVALIDLLFAV
ncbi:MAG: S8 family serine peptidase [Pirellulales bacterium]|nr:S8 family serine peptidase [Pirellulales bacterium]